MPDRVPPLSERLEQIRRCLSEPVVIPERQPYDWSVGKDFTEERLEQLIRWTKLCTLLDTWTKQGVTLAAELDEARQLLPSIPADVRTAPNSWYATIRHDEWVDEWAAWTVHVDKITGLLDPPHPAWPLVGSIILTQELETRAVEQAFCTAPIMAHLEGLFMARQPDHTVLDSPFIATLLGSGAWHNLRYFTSTGHALTGRTLADFAAWPGLDHLVALKIFDGSMSAWGVNQFITSPRLLALERLDLPSCGLRDDTAMMLASAPKLSRLQQLDLRFNNFTDAGKAALTTSPALQGVKVLL